MHIYAFGSVCRGDIDINSDIDLLAIVDGEDNRFSPDVYSIYSYSRVSEIWAEGNPFAWHLFLESKLIYSSNENNYLSKLGRPSAYSNGTKDCEKFHQIFLAARESINKSSLCEIFDLSIIFLSIRNFATCFSLSASNKPDFSRNSAINLGSNSICITAQQYQVLEKARILSTRGVGSKISKDEIHLAMGCIESVNDWMVELLDSDGINSYE